MALAQRTFRQQAGVGSAGGDAEGSLRGAAVAGMHIEHAGGTVLETHGPGAFVQFQLLHHVAVEGRGGAGIGRTLDSVEGIVEQDAVEVEADAAVIGATQGEAGVVVVIRSDPGQALHGAQRIVGKDAGQVLGVIAGEFQRGGAVLARGVERPGAHIDRIGLAERVGAEDDVEVLGLAGIQVEGLGDEPVAHCGDVEDIVARIDRGDGEAAGGVRSGPVGAAHQLDGDVRKRLTAARVYYGAADHARLLSKRREDQEQEGRRTHEGGYPGPPH